MDFKPKRVFEIARELKITTPEILEFLQKCGFNISRRQMQPVDSEMLGALLWRFDRPQFNLYAAERRLDAKTVGQLSSIAERAMIARRPRPLAVERKPIKPTSLLQLVNVALTAGLKAGPTWQNSSPTNLSNIDLEIIKALLKLRQIQKQRLYDYLLRR
ncbi:MAG: hypothetical protein FJY65_08960 [Calditrichaeota bacterium]|nr:hypothetical protein [Calditrichota bacterium]